MGWTHARQLVRVQRTAENPNTGKTSVGNRYYVTSLSTDALSPNEVMKISRGHWRCENETHWTADAELQEDRRRHAWSRHPTSPQRRPGCDAATHDGLGHPGRGATDEPAPTEKPGVRPAGEGGVQAEAGRRPATRVLLSAWGDYGPGDRSVQAAGKRRASTVANPHRSVYALTARAG